MYDFFWHGGHDEKREAGGNQRGQADKPAHNAIQRVEGDVCFQEQLEEYGPEHEFKAGVPCGSGSHREGGGRLKG